MRMLLVQFRPVLRLLLVHRSVLCVIVQYDKAVAEKCTNF